MRLSPAQATWPSSPITIAPSPKGARLWPSQHFVGNAGVFDVYAPLAEFSEARLSEAFDDGVNVKGCFVGTKAACPN
jgi:hypothetical protein